MDSINQCLEEILKDENGNVITPSCGVEKLLSMLCECASDITKEDIDEITSS